MRFFAYQYISSIQFSDFVRQHSWSIRCTPKQEKFQHIDYADLLIEVSGERGSTSVKKSSIVDAFGNFVHYGFIRNPHNSVKIHSQGIIKQSDYVADGLFHGMYLAKTPLTTPSKAMIEFKNDALSQCKQLDVDKKAYILSNAVYSHMEYRKGLTSVKSMASDAFSMKKGVCQDYAHILLSLLRLEKIPCRYVCGFIIGEGETHSWVEYFSSGAWLPIDPTNNKTPDFGFIKIAHGRDSADCPVNRGVFSGNTTQKTFISVKVEEV